MGKTETFSVAFTVSNFSQVSKGLSSPFLIEQDLKWRIFIKPTYNGQTKSLGYFLYCDGPDGGNKSSSWSCRAAADLMIMALKPGVDMASHKLSPTLFHSKNSKADNWGVDKFMKWEDIMSTKRGLIEDNSVTFVARITAEEPQRCKRCEERTCKVCMKEEACMMFDPCGHLSTCKECSLDMDECPICRMKIDKKIQAFV